MKHDQPGSHRGMNTGYHMPHAGGEHGMQHGMRPDVQSGEHPQMMTMRLRQELWTQFAVMMLGAWLIASP